MVAAIATPSVGLADFEMLLNRLLPSVPAPAPPPRSVTEGIETVSECLLSSTPAPVSASPPRSSTTDIETMLRRLLLPGLVGTGL